MIFYKLKVMVDQEWLDVLDVSTQHQEGFMWEDIEVAEYEECCHCGCDNE